MISKLFSLSSLLIVFFVLSHFLSLTGYNLYPQNVPSLKHSSAHNSTSSAILENDQIVYEVARGNLEIINSQFNTLMTISLVILTILGLGIGIAALFTWERVRQIDKALTDAEGKSEKVKQMLENAQSVSSSSPTPIPPHERSEAIRQAQPSSLSPSTSPSPSPSPSPEIPNEEDLVYIKQAHFEKTYRLIFGSQLTILKAMLSSPPSYTISKALVEAVHRRSKYKDIQFIIYVEFLTNSLLMGIHTNGDYFLTQLGLEFLQYLFQNGMPDKIE